jgi:hypothetical protein
MQNDRLAIDTEEYEQRQIFELIESEVAGLQAPVILLDLHSTSADSTPFCIISDTLQNRRNAFAFSIPVVLGLEEAINGTIQDYYGERGYITAAIEGGQHNDPATADRLESTLWITLVTSGLVDAGCVRELDEHRRRLRQVCKGSPSVVEVVYRYEKSERDGFRMLDGFSNFSPVRRGQLVATDSGGEIHAQTTGMLVLPSYQASDDDGYFLGRRVRRFWLRLSSAARRLRIDHLMHVLPGVCRRADDHRVLAVDPSIARWWVLKVFHLFGFRMCGAENGSIIFRRRPEGAPLLAGDDRTVAGRAP